LSVATDPDIGKAVLESSEEVVLDIIGIAEIGAIGPEFDEKVVDSVADERFVSAPSDAVFVEHVEMLAIDGLK
jgi:hypothetical protein